MKMTKLPREKHSPRNPIQKSPVSSSDDPDRMSVIGILIMYDTIVIKQDVVSADL